jgi:hypothetical protein
VAECVACVAFPVKKVSNLQDDDTQYLVTLFVPIQIATFFKHK